MGRILYPVRRGRTLELLFTAFLRGFKVDDLAARIDLTTYAIRFAMKLNATSSGFTFQKNDVVNPLDVVRETQSGSTLGQYRVFLRTGDTAALAIAEYVYDTTIIATAGAGDPHDVETGAILIKSSVDDLA